MKSQYMIAILPDDKLKNQLEAVRQKFSDTYEVYEALKNPIHVTLVPPFHCNDEVISNIEEQLKDLASNTCKFHFNLLGFGTLKKQSNIHRGPIIK